jgi:diaminohydroxyphosphoribosylaminopyrimidine deaminase/5-amino-6-(5-phosphoribosylamino)uracil reductase
MKSPIRVVIDPALRLPLASRLVTTARAVPVWVAALQDAPQAPEQALTAQGVEVLRVPARAGGVDLGEVLKRLAQRGITRLLVEGGPTLAAALLRDDFIDAAVLFRSTTMTIGGDGIDALEGLPLTALTRSSALGAMGSELIGADRVETFERA